MLALRLPEEIELRLDKLAKMTGRTKSFYIGLDRRGRSRGICAIHLCHVIWIALTGALTKRPMPHLVEVTN
jgi:hypothetical protein